jgi:hypothetical protein
MNPQHVLQRLAQEGYELIVNTQYHVQIPCAKGKHNIWFDKIGEMTLQCVGQRSPHSVGINKLLAELKQYSYEKTDLGIMEVVKFIQKVPIKQGIYVDAGFKNGLGRIAVIRVQNGAIDVHIREIGCQTPFEAEDNGIRLAAELFPGEEPIYNDNLAAVERNAPRAQWIDRIKNRDADRLSNLRS